MSAPLPPHLSPSPCPQAAPTARPLLTTLRCVSVAALGSPVVPAGLGQTACDADECAFWCTRCTRVAFSASVAHAGHDKARVETRRSQLGRNGVGVSGFNEALFHSSDEGGEQQSYF